MFAFLWSVTWNMNNIYHCIWTWLFLAFFLILTLNSNHFTIICYKNTSHQQPPLLTTFKVEMTISCQLMIFLCHFCSITNSNYNSQDGMSNHRLISNSRIRKTNILSDNFLITKRNELRLEKMWPFPKMVNLTNSFSISYHWRIIFFSFFPF